MTQSTPPKPPAKPAAPAAPKPPAKPETIEIVEFVDHLPRSMVALLLIAGIALGAVVVYLALNLVIEDASDG